MEHASKAHAGLRYSTEKRESEVESMNVTSETTMQKWRPLVDQGRRSKKKGGGGKGGGKEVKQQKRTTN